MRNKILVLLALVMLSSLPMRAMADEKNFPAESLIIPMGSYYQPEADLYRHRRQR